MYYITQAESSVELNHMMVSVLLLAKLSNCGSLTMSIALEIQELGDDFIYYYVIKETPKQITSPLF